MLKSGINLIKDIDSEKREVIFAFSKFDYDSDNDLTQSTAFDKTIQESGPSGSNRIRHVWNHDRKDLPIGAIKEMWRDNEYAYVRSGILKNAKANDTMDAYKAGAINEHSYWGKSFNHGVNEKGGKLIKEVKLFEVSTVLWGAQENAKLLEMIKSGVKPESYLNEYLDDLLKYVKSSSASDDFLETLELELLKGKDILESLEKSSRVETLEVIEPRNKIELTLSDIYKLKSNY
jgi:HK97 family phage prohead protease